MLSKVVDPELNINIVDLGLIYGAEVTDRHVKITMTLTTPFCPYASSLIQEVKDQLNKNNYSNVEVVVVFDPIWDPSIMASQEVKDLLGIW
ncbi:MAG: metal-sulfur cluster assembly factor [Patescibacteria group bacterium]